MAGAATFSIPACRHETVVRQVGLLVAQVPDAIPAERSQLASISTWYCSATVPDGKLSMVHMPSSAMDPSGNERSTAGKMVLRIPVDCRQENGESTSLLTTAQPAYLISTPWMWLTSHNLRHSKKSSGNTSAADSFCSTSIRDIRPSTKRFGETIESWRADAGRCAPLVQDKQAMRSQTLVAMQGAAGLLDTCRSSALTGAGIVGERTEPAVSGGCHWRSSHR